MVGTENLLQQVSDDHMDHASHLVEIHGDKIYEEHYNYVLQNTQVYSFQRARSGGALRKADQLCKKSALILEV